MKPAAALTPLTPSHERIVRAVGEFRYMLAPDVTNLLFSPSSLTYVREALAVLSGGTDYAQGHYLFRFPLPATTRDNRTKVYTLGSAGRRYLRTHSPESGSWQAREEKGRTLSHSALTHNLLLTRLVVCAHLFCRSQPDFRLSEVRLSYALSKDPVLLSHPFKGNAPQALLVPDAWVCFERSDGLICPILFELDRAMEYKAAFTTHVRARIEMISSGLYSRVFAHSAVKIAYVTIGQSQRARSARRTSMASWTRQVLAEYGVSSWASVFNFAELAPEQLYQHPDLFTAPCWHQPGSTSPVALLPRR